jgi:hypothetical protein
MVPKISILYKTTFRPTGAFYLGVHDTEDLAFGTHEFKDPFIGSGTKLIALAKSAGNRRSLFNVQALAVSTRKECEDKLKKLLNDLDYTNPLTLNSREGYPAGRPQAPEHRLNLSAALSEGMKGNENATGRREPNIDIDTPTGTKLKWFNNGTDQKMILADLQDNPIKPEYKDWKLGKMHKNPHVQKRLEEIKAAEPEQPEDGE